MEFAFFCGVLLFLWNFTEFCKSLEMTDDQYNHRLHNVQGGPKKRHKVNDTIILQLYVIESCGFQQNVPKVILYMTKVSI